MMRPDKYEAGGLWPFPGDESLYAQGYYAGLVNDRANPCPPWSFAATAWHLGNQWGLTVHCAVVEAVYLDNIKLEDVA